MAQPITEIKKNLLTEEEQKQKKLEALTTLLANNDEALNKVLTIVGELNDIGVLEAADSMLQAKEKIAQIALHQVSREPVTNLINTLMGATGALMKTDPELITKLVNSAMKGMDEANDYLQTDKKVKVMDLVKLLNDPDINRALGFGIHFLKGMGKELKH
ncbi:MULTISPECIES: DUF1641 domain-containing protein [Peribacillus]|uniref:Uncharacterized protein n=1 Tax=Peribacillus asahii TaxID=228899 RepID=A0A3Q9RRH3_9BACI|nr:DUF1641 domain-containing protein [Peribacillus asahii]AZV44924.1 hypothetical protein BAOM_4344 [Peribacillus asahii]USK69653.1 DUF1641 domain-containing protein [Peribacillus asahii]USK84552.1 DUF1641 domain-containing protein [Peribacillus asahii]